MQDLGPERSGMQPATRSAAAAASPCIALFPGSFKPPHAAHLHAVRFLVEQKHITRVVIIIANRCRHIPGSDKALDAVAARKLLHRMLRFAKLPLQKISVEIAEHRALTMALDYFNRVGPSTSLLFCVGQADFTSRDDRFVRVEELSTLTGIPARIEVLPRAPIDVHATELRRCIADGGVSKKTFLAAMPVEFSNLEKEAIWAENRRLLKPMGTIAKLKIRQALCDRYTITLDDLRETPARSINPDFLLESDSAENLIAKYAGDTTDDGSFDEEMVQKPARRLVVEKRVLAHLARHLDDSFVRPEVVFFNKAQRICVLTKPSSSATTVATMLRSGCYDIGVATSQARLLAQIHQCPLPAHPFWGDAAAERNHWAMLLSSLEDRGNDRLKALHRSDLARDLVATVGRAARPCMLHLNFVPENLWQHRGRLGIENFERACCYGDPAFDVATAIAGCVLQARQRQMTSEWLGSVHILASTYRRLQTQPDPTFPGRLTTYIGYQLLVATVIRGKLCTPVLHDQQLVDLLERIPVELSAQCAISIDELLRPLLTATKLRTAN